MANDINLRILIIDDNPEIHKDFIKILVPDDSANLKIKELEAIIFDLEEEHTSAPEFQIDSALQGEEGVQKVSDAIKKNKPYALAFVDVRMPPGWDGIKTIKHIFEIDPDIQIVICSAYSDYSWEETIEQLGQRDNLLILRKPFDNMIIRQMACALTRKWQVLKELHETQLYLESRVAEKTASLQQSFAVTRGTLESSNEGVLVVSDVNSLIDYNQKLLDLWDIPESLVTTRDAHLLLNHILDKVEEKNNFSQIIDTLSNSLDLIKTDKLKCKNNRMLEYYSQPYLLNGKFAGRIWNFRDITQQDKLEQELRHLSTHDMLTGLPNRTLLMDRIHQAIASANRSNTMIGLLFFDLDRFKLINDSFSHVAGDELLKAVAKRLLSFVREEDTCARLGGDEFVIFGTIKNKNDLQILAAKLLNIFTKPFNLLGKNLMISSSIGMSAYPEDSQSVDELLSHADIAMYRAKAKGKGKFQCYDAEIGRQIFERWEKENRLVQALENEEFFLVYQPQININTGTIFSMEALIRWQHPEQGIIMPDDFLPIAEESNLINRIGDWVLQTACQQNKLWQDMGLPKIRVAINIANQQVKQFNLVEKIKNTLQESGLEPKYLELELTERVIINSVEAFQIITDLSKMGISISLDDFGTGNSALSYLKSLPIDRIKIDKSFIKTLNKTKSDQMILKAMILIAKSLNISVMAEGVETKSQMNFLKSKHCLEAQGYYFSYPLIISEIENLLRKQEQTSHDS